MLEHTTLNLIRPHTLEAKYYFSKEWLFDVIGNKPTDYEIIS
jgi:hypothetical protein